METETNNLPVKIEEQIQSSGMANLSRAQEIAINYAPYLQQIDEQADIVKGLKKGNPEHVAIAKRARLDIGKICSAVGERKKEDKQTILIAGKFIDGLYNTVNGAGRLTQGEAKEIEDHAEMIEKAKKDKLRAKRENEISEFDVNPGIGDIADMNEEVWGYYIDGLKNDRDIRIAAEEKVERERIEEQRINELNTERRKSVIDLWQFMPKENKEVNFGSWEGTMWDELVNYLVLEKAVYDKEQKRIKAENEKLKEEAELKQIADAKAEKERKQLAKIDQDKRDKIERERQAKAEVERKQREAKEEKERAAHLLELKKEREEKERIQKELLAKVEVERKRKDAEQLELIHIQKEKEKAKADARKAELASDKEKLTKWLRDMVIDGSLDDKLSKESVLIASEIIDKFNKFKTWATEKVNEIK